MVKNNSQKKNTETPAQLKRRIAELEKANKELAKGKSDTPDQVNWFRRLSAWLLVVLSATLIITSIFLIWIQRTVLETETWTDKTTQIIQTSSVQDDVTKKVTDEIFSQIDVQQVVEEALPERAAPLSAPIASGIEGFVKDKTRQVIASPKFAEVWVEVNTASHESLVKSIERLNTIDAENNSSDVVYIVDDTLMLNLRPVLDEVKADLIANGLTFLPEKQVVSQNRVTFEVAQINNLPTILGAYNALNSLTYWLPVLGVALGAGAVFVSNNRRRTFGALVILILILAVATVQIIKAGQYAVTQNISSSNQAVSVESATAIYRIITDDLITSLRWLMSAAVLIGAFIFLSGPTSAATSLRASAGKLIKNYKQNGLVVFIAEHASAIISVIGLIIAAIVVFADFSTPQPALWLIGLGALICVAILVIKQEVDR